MTDVQPQEDDDQNDVSPIKRLYQLVRLSASSAGIAVLLGLISISGQELYHKLFPTETVKVRKLAEADYNRVVDTLETTSANLDTLHKLVVGNPEALVLVTKLKRDVLSVDEIITSASAIEKTAEFRLPFKLISEANASETKGKVDDANDAPPIFLYVLYGLVVFVAVLFSLLFVFSKDKTKTAFAEKTITTIIGFVLGMLTGSNASRIK